jgi:hypothetical protein
MPIQPWARRATKDGRAASVMLFAFADAALPAPLPLSRAKHGVPEGDGMKHVGIASIARAQAPEWFDGFFAEPGASIARGELGDETFDAIRGSSFVHRIDAQVVDPGDLGYLQAAWALARCVCESGAGAVLDAHAIRWWSRASIARWPLEGAFDVDREITLVLETDATPGSGQLLHTRGMAKLARPDLVIALHDPSERDVLGKALRELARRAATGVALEPDTRTAAEGQRFQLVRPPPELPELGLNNDAVALEKLS